MFQEITNNRLFRSICIFFSCYHLALTRKSLQFLIVLTAMLGMQISSNAQMLSPELLANGGGYGQNSNMHISWSIGEPVSNTISNSTTVFTQGFHQPSIILSTNNHTLSNIAIDVYPNPTSDILRIRLEEEADLKVYDLLSKLLIQQSIFQQAELDLRDWSNGVYLLQIVSEKYPNQIYKIEKIAP